MTADDSAISAQVPAIAVVVLVARPILKSVGRGLGREEFGRAVRGDALHEDAGAEREQRDRDRVAEARDERHGPRQEIVVVII